MNDDFIDEDKFFEEVENLKKYPLDGGVVPDDISFGIAVQSAPHEVWLTLIGFLRQKGFPVVTWVGHGYEEVRDDDGEKEPEEHL